MVVWMVAVMGGLSVGGYRPNGKSSTNFHVGNLLDKAQGQSPSKNGVQSKSKGPFGAPEVKILYVTENYLPMGRYYLKESKISDTAQPNMSSISSTGDS
ncbi:hypothetical protein PCANC_05123 [Puccinia coronata f. sp. avenae]|uniref:Uncharacterized protein n=1 Tax=Puccinia coronata f. sp. avenae TaxID=200324 RepID=A0A2N5W381_9BASI|nr:hypothetical protein PCANC_05123 [Puccinia coronata f. sp. avenae]